MKYDLIIEKLSGHDTSGKVGKINKKTDDILNSGDVIFTIESGKGTIKYISKYKGTLEELLIAEGDTVKKGQVIGRVEGELIQQELKKTTYSFGLAKPLSKSYEVDVAIVGGGPGGYVAAIRAAQGGKKVLIIEQDRLGGTCLNYGCIPTKALVSSIDVLEKIRHAQSFGIEVGGVKASLERIMRRKNEVVDTLVSGIEHLMEAHQIEYINGEAEVKDAETLTVKNKSIDATIKFGKLIIATGSKPAILPIEGAGSEDILTSQDLLELTEVPSSVTIIGGGVIGMEFAFIYNALGAKVNVVEYFPQILNTMDEDAADIIRESAAQRGINLYEGAKALSIKTALDGTKIVEIDENKQTKYLISEKVAMAVGRKANLESLDLKMLKVELNEKRNGISVDAHMRTSNPNVYAIGDITNKIQLAHVASHQGIIAADHINGIQDEMCYDLIPSAIFTMPEIGHVGLTEKDAVSQKLDYITGKFPLMANGKAQAMGETEGFVKLIAGKETRKIIGGTIVGVHATDMLSTISNIIASGLTIDKAAHVIYAHPTTAESIHEALLSIDGRGIHFA
ncbi:dihydrolipoyl dehydrogenase [Lutispora saccharofermentans]|uniref:Dihydrolipoyl dehydrogenase n=1 Tax=Lutispora saccharofermentans TaxID=3024236 RepID=A0ABT1NGJ5_9FIRM|nr:dihydrolipoyl dehydrogenase [Lutispora saccharofermentans]MCQ1530415.1 dihydrolipoyl dehydrogenase [Lutispora saccharofermentans]